MARIDQLIAATNGAALPRVISGRAENGQTVKRGRVYTANGKKSTSRNAYRVYGMLDYNGKNYYKGGYQVHHINGRHEDNRRSNCITVSHELHTFIHQVMAQLCNDSRYHYATAQDMVTINVKATYMALAIWAEEHTV